MSIKTAKKSLPFVNQEAGVGISSKASKPPYRLAGGRFLFFLPFYGTAVLTPLLSSSGRNLEYEYLLALSALVLLLLPVAGALIPHRLLPSRDAWLADTLLSLFISPLVAITTALALFQWGGCLCSREGYLFWFAVNAYPAWILAHAGAYYVMHGRRRGRSRPFLLSTTGLAFLAAFLVTALLMWFFPQKRAVSLLLGFLHGPVYDDWIIVDTGVLWARLSHALLAVFLLLLSWQRPWTRRGRVALLALNLAALGCFMAAQGYPSAPIGQEPLAQLLPDTWQYEGLTLRFKRSSEPGNHQAIARLIAEARFHYEELTKSLGEVSLPPVVVYAYNDDDEKKIWFGGGGTDVTDVYTPSVHITLTSGSYDSLRHELVHALASDFAYHGLGFHPNMAFTEGLAVALAPSPTPLSLHAHAAALLHSQKLPPLQELFSPLFWREAGPRAYTVAGSFIQFLLQRYGMEPVKALYGGASFDEAFPGSGKAVMTAWQAEMATHHQDAAHKLFQEALYRDPGIFSDRCPHSKADLHATHDASPLIAWRRPSAWQAQRDYEAWRLSLDPSDKGLAAGPLLTAVGSHPWANALPTGPVVQAWLVQLNALRTFPPQVLEDVELAIVASDLLLLSDRAASLKLLQDLEALSKRIFIGDSLVRQLVSRLQITRQLDPQQAFAWRLYLAGWRPLPVRSANLADTEPWLLSYLRLRRDNKLDVGSLRQLTRQTVDSDLPPTFAVEWYRLLAQRLAAKTAWLDSAHAWDQAAERASSGQTEYYLQQRRLALYHHRLDTTVPAPPH